MLKNKYVFGVAEDTIVERQKVYGSPDQFFKKLALRWSATLHTHITPQQCLLCMMDLKAQRLAGDPTHEDSLIDLAAYMLILTDFEKDLTNGEQ